MRQLLDGLLCIVGMSVSLWPLKKLAPKVYLTHVIKSNIRGTQHLIDKKKKMLLWVDKFQISHFCNVVRASVRLIETLTAL